MLTFLVWVLLFIVCWPLAILALVLYPLVWLVLLPFRILGFAVGGVLAFLKGLFFLPARLLGRQGLTALRAGAPGASSRRAIPAPASSSRRAASAAAPSTASRILM